MKTATLVCELANFRGDTRLYSLSEPAKAHNDVEVDHVIVSAVSPLSGPKTHIFPSNAKGEVLDWLEMPGSFRGELNHAKALLNAGYTIAGE